VASNVLWRWQCSCLLAPVKSFVAHNWLWNSLGRKPAMYALRADGQDTHATGAARACALFPSNRSLPLHLNRFASSLLVLVRQELCARLIATIMQSLSCPIYGKAALLHKRRRALTRAPRP
jgi:hypothetical protein